MIVIYFGKRRGVSSQMCVGAARGHLGGDEGPSRTHLEDFLSRTEQSQVTGLSSAEGACQNHECHRPETSTTPGRCNPGTWTAQINDLNQSLESSGMQRALMMEAVRTSETSVYSKGTTLMMEAVRTSETSFYSKETTLLYIPEVSKLHTRRRENLKSYNELNQQPQKTRELCEQLK
jgi:hypothetical protein